MKLISGFETGMTDGHSAGDAGVTVTIVRASKVGVKVGMVGRGVMDGVAGIFVDTGVVVWLGCAVVDGKVVS